MTWCFSRTGVGDLEAQGVGGTTGTETVPDLEEGRICVLTDLGDESWIGRELAEDATVDPEDANDTTVDEADTQVIVWSKGMA